MNPELTLFSQKLIDTLNQCLFQSQYIEYKFQTEQTDDMIKIKLTETNINPFKNTKNEYSPRTIATITTHQHSINTSIKLETLGIHHKNLNILYDDLTFIYYPNSESKLLEIYLNFRLDFERIPNIELCHNDQTTLLQIDDYEHNRLRHYDRINTYYYSEIKDTTIDDILIFLPQIATELNNRWNIENEKNDVYKKHIALQKFLAAQEKELKK